MGLKISKYIFDNVHGHIGLTDVELKVIDSTIFQRLRRIRQTGCVDFVYPGAIHTRFSHSIGTMFLMGKFLSTAKKGGDSLADDDDEVQRMRLAALLHDIGHYPFSHTIEQVAVNEFGAMNHEALGAGFIKKFLKEKLDNYSTADIAGIIEKKGKSSLKALLSSAFDVDKCDYLLRDSYYTGVSYGEIEVDRLIQTMSIEDGRIIFDRDETELESFLLGRYHMYRAIYHHKTVVGFEQMLKRAFGMLVKEGEVRNPKDIASEDNEIEISGYDDNMLSQKMHEYALNGRNKGLRDLVQALIKRVPAALVYMEPRPAGDAAGNAIEKRIARMEADSKELNKFAEKCGADPMWIFPISLRKLSLIDEKSDLYIRKDKEIKSLKSSDSLIMRMIGSMTLYDTRVYAKQEYAKRARQALMQGRY